MFVSGFSCIILLVVVQLCPAALATSFQQPTQVDQIARQSRRLLDLLVGKFRPCIYCTCGKSNRSGARFLGGENTLTHEFPWLASVHRRNSLPISGTLINDRYVLTAASPLAGTTPPDIKVSLGEYDRCNLQVSSANMSVEAVIWHPEFNHDSHAHDVALIRLSRSTLFERRLLPICLPEPGTSYLGRVGTLMGWPETGQQASAAINASESVTAKRRCQPRKLGLPILGRRECMASGVNPQDYHEESGCIGVVGTNPIVCQDDVGTSLLYRSYSGTYDLIGIISDKNNCNSTVEKPVGTAIYTRIGPYLDWIYQNTKDACYCLRPLELPELKSSMYAY